MSAEFYTLNYNHLTIPHLWHTQSITGKRVCAKSATGVRIPLTPLTTAERRMCYHAFGMVAKSGKKAFLGAKKPQNERRR